MYALRDVTRAFSSGDRRVEALAGIDLEIAAGEHLAITGPSGSGKTTLLQLLGALDRPSGGTLDFEGRALNGLRERDLTALRLERIGFVFQQFNLVPTLSARGNVEAALDPLGLRARDRRARAAERLAEVGLADRAGHLPSQLSGGEQQRVAIARALATEPHVVLADEPTGNLDRASAEVVAGLLEALAGEGGRTVVVVTHDADLAARAPRVVLLQDGRVLSDGEARSLVSLRAVELPVGDVATAERWYAYVLGVPAAAGVVTLGRGAEIRLVLGAARGGRTLIETSDLGSVRGRLDEGEATSEGLVARDPWGNALVFVHRSE